MSGRRRCLWPLSLLIVLSLPTLVSAHPGLSQVMDPWLALVSALRASARGPMAAWAMGAGAIAGLIWILQLRGAVARRTADLQREVAQGRLKEEALHASLTRLREQGERLSFSLERMPLAFIVWDAQFRVQEWNEEAQRIFGWSAGQAIGAGAWELMLQGLGRAGAWQQWQQMLAEEDSHWHSMANVRADGSEVFCSWHLRLQRNEAGEVIGALALLDDVTSVVLGERERAAQLTQLAAVFESMGALVVVSELDDGEVIFANSRAQKRLGQLGGGRLFWGASAGEPNQEALQEELCCHDGRWYARRRQQVGWTDGRPVLLEVALDVTERKQLEKLKDDMISAVSHEMRTPLTALLGYADLLLEGPLTSEAAAGLRVMRGQAHRLTRLVDNFLAIQRLRSRPAASHYERVDLAEILLEQAAPLIGASELHRLDLQFDQDLPEVCGERGALGRLVDNLLANAVKYSPAGGEVVLRAAAAEQGVLLQVIDQGVGIAAAHHERIFERFYRVDGGDTATTPGAGLGLALAAEVARAHGGRIWVESAPGAGSTFSVWLPQATKCPA